LYTWSNHVRYRLRSTTAGGQQEHHTRIHERQHLSLWRLRRNSGGHRFRGTRDGKGL